MMEKIYINNDVLEFNKIIFVSSENGDDTNIGDKDNPIRTIEKALTLVEENSCVYLNKGTYEIETIDAFITNYQYSMIGECKDTLVYVLKGTSNKGRESSVKTSIMRMIIKVREDGFISGDSRAFVYWTGSAVPNIDFHNVLFKRSANTPTSDFFFFTNSGGGVDKKSRFFNCTAELPNGARIGQGCTGVYATNFCSTGTLSGLSEVVDNSHLESVVIDSDGNISSDGWVGTGIGKNPNGTQSNKGVYGGLYAWGEWSSKCVIEQGGLYYTIKDESLVKLDGISEEIFERDSCRVYEVNRNLHLLNDSFKLIFKDKVDIDVKSIKTKKELIVASNSFSTKIQENIDYFKCEYDKSGTSQIKIAFSIDDGIVWKSYNGTDFVDLGIEIPMKEFEALSNEELDKWNNAKEEILINGIDIDILQTLDFNVLDFDKIRFAYAISLETTDDIAINKNLIWQFDSKGSMQQLKDSEFDLKLHSNGVEFKSLIDADMVKVNILPNGVAVSGDADFATDSDIDDMFN